MKDPLFNTLSGLASIGIVLAAVLLAGGGQDRPAAQTGQPGLFQAAEASEPEAGEEMPQRKSRRVRASLSMPYFSFAQSLRPRG